MKDKLKEIEDIIIEYGQIDGAHHKTWVLDQVMRVAKGDKYKEFIKWYEYTDYNGNECVEKEYSWDTGTAP